MCDKNYFDCMFAATKRPSLKSVKNKIKETFEPVSGTRKILLLYSKSGLKIIFFARV